MTSGEAPSRKNPPLISPARRSRRQREQEAEAAEAEAAEAEEETSKSFLPSSHIPQEGARARETSSRARAFPSPAKKGVVCVLARGVLCLSFPQGGLTAIVEEEEDAGEEEDSGAYANEDEEKSRGTSCRGVKTLSRSLFFRPRSLSFIRQKGVTKFSNAASTSFFV